MFLFKTTGKCMHTGTHSNLCAIMSFKFSSACQLVFLFVRKCSGSLSYLHIAALFSFSSSLFCFSSLHSSHFFFVCVFPPFYLHDHLPVTLMSTSSGCMVSGLHSGWNDPGKCVVPWHWSYPSPSLITVSSLHSLWRDPPSSWELPIVPLLFHPENPPWSTSSLRCTHFLWERQEKLVENGNSFWESIN